jgi:hypothetical protein
LEALSFKFEFVNMRKHADSLRVAGAMATRRHGEIATEV